MNKEDYSKYYIQGSDHYLIPKDVFDELFNEMSNWKEDTKKLKEIIDKVIDMCIVVYGGDEDFYVDRIIKIKQELEKSDINE